MFEQLSIPDDPSYFLPPSTEARAAFAAAVSPLKAVVEVEYERGIKAVYEQPGLPTLVAVCSIARRHSAAHPDGSSEPMPNLSASIHYEQPVDQRDQSTWNDLIVAHSAYHDRGHGKWLDMLGEALTPTRPVSPLARMQELLEHSPHPVGESKRYNHRAIYNNKTGIMATWVEGDATYLRNHAKRIPEHEVQVTTSGSTYRYEQHADGKERLMVSGEDVPQAVVPISQEPEGIVADVADLFAQMRYAEEQGLNNVTGGKLTHMTGLITQARASGLRLFLYA